jgi:DNA-binding CsgD family transcriptional regulator
MERTLGKMNHIYGILSMGLITKWILFFPYYGPALNMINFHNTSFPHLFTLTHIIGLLHGTWIYRKTSKSFIIWFLSKFGLMAIAFLTIAAPFIPSVSLYMIIIVLPIGYISGFVVSRWMTWFSCPDYNSTKGRILGLTVCVTYILLYLNTLIMVLPQNGVILAFIFSSMAVFIGGFLVVRLPITPSNDESISFRNIFPPLQLLIFGVFSYSTISLIYRTILTAHLQHITLSWIIVVIYIGIGFYMWKWADQYDRYYFSIIAFFTVGIGFIIFSLATKESQLNLLVEILMIIGLMYIHFYYWLSLVDRQNPKTSPFPFVIGVSIELIACAIVFFSISRMDIPLFPIKIVGSVGASLILIGLCIISLHNYQLYKKISTQLIGSNTAIREFPKSNDNGTFPVGLMHRFLYFQNNSKDSLQKALLKNFNLTHREAEVTYYILIGQSNEEITSILSISPNTLKYHIKNIYSKLGVTCRENAIEYVYTEITL